MRAILVVAMSLLVLLPAAVAAQYAVGDAVASADGNAPLDADTIVTATGTRTLAGGGNVSLSVDVMCNGDATFYFYERTAAGVVRRVWGPFYCRSWMSGRNPLPYPSKADMIHVTSLTGTEFVITPRGY